MMTHPRRAFLLFLTVTTTACGPDVIDHDPSNPDDLRTECPLLPEGIPPMEGTDTAAARIADGQLALFFSDRLLSCEEGMDVFGTGPELTQSTGECINGNDFQLAVPDELAAPGSYDLSDYLDIEQPEDGSMYWSQQGEFDSGISCGIECTMSGSGGSITGGTLEIFTVDDDCITGRIIDLEVLGEVGLLPDGGFRAPRC